MINVSNHAAATLEREPSREPSRDLGNLVDIGYYQLLLSSSILTNLELLEKACFTAGVQIGAALAAHLRDQANEDAVGAITAFYRRLRYLDLSIEDTGETFEIQVAEAPESLGPMADTTLVPFLCGELESLLSELGGRPVTFAGNAPNDAGFSLRFSPRQ